jgi:hypothetical protein
MLNEAVRSLKAGKEPDLAAPLSTTTEINLHVPALLPADFCGDVHERLSIYKRLANCEPQDKIDDMQEELIDRFGKLPDAGQGADRDPPPAHRRQDGRHRQDRRPCEAASLQFMEKPPIDPIKHHHADPEEPPHQAGRPGQAAHHRRHAGPGRAREPGQANHQTIDSLASEPCPRN